MMELLKLSESRAALVGGVAVDTLCLGVLALLLLQPAMFGQGHSGVIVLIALALTAPVLASCSVLLSFALAGRFDLEERARRTIMAASVLHGGVQLSTLVGMMCAKGPSTFSSYFLSTWLLTMLLAGSLLIISWVLRTFRKSEVQRQDCEPPPARL